MSGLPPKADIADHDCHVRLKLGIGHQLAQNRSLRGAGRAPGGVDGDEDRLAGLLRRREGVRREGLGLGGERLIGSFALPLQASPRQHHVEATSWHLPPSSQRISPCLRLLYRSIVHGAPALP